MLKDFGIANKEFGIVNQNIANIEEIVDRKLVVPEGYITIF